MASYDKQFMLKVVEEYLTGEGGAKLLARKHGLHEEKIRLWVSRYRAHGTAGLYPKRGSYSTDFKLEVLQRQHREQLSCRQVARFMTYVTRIKLPFGGRNMRLAAYQHLRPSIKGVLERCKNQNYPFAPAN